MNEIRQHAWRVRAAALAVMLASACADATGPIQSSPRPAPIVDPMNLANAETIAGLSGAEGSVMWFIVRIPEHVSILTIIAAGGTGRPDLSARHGALPSPLIADCRAVTTITNLACAFDNPAAGDYWIMLSGYGDYAGVSLTANWQTGTVLAVTTEPADTARSGARFARQPVVELRDVDGAIARQADVAVSAHVMSGAAVLTGTTTILTDADGRARFTDLGLIGEGEHTLQFRITGAAPTLSAVVTLPLPLLSSSAEANLGGAAGSNRWYVIDVPQGAASLTVTSSGGMGNVDLYLRHDALPGASFACSSTGPATQERCEVVNPASGAWYVRLAAKADYAGTSLAVPTGRPCSLTTGGDSDGDRLPDCAETNTGVYLSPVDTGTDPANADTDGDRIPDGDEVLGTTLALDLPAMGLSPLRRDILVEFDWFADNLECGPHSHRPTSGTIAMLTAAFARAPLLNPDGSTGINLVADAGQGGAFTGGNAIADPNGVIDGGIGSPEFETYRSANFAANRAGYFHYAFLPHRYNTNSGSSGAAEQPGRNLIVSLYCANSDFNVASTTMHELGHNLRLDHGGFENVNLKPNYNSVMNYLYQFVGVDGNCTAGGAGFLAFSPGSRPPLDENNLDEAQGVCGAPPGPGSDWNGDGDVLDFQLARDINGGVGGPGDGILMVLRDYDDWGNLRFGPAPATLAALLVPPAIVSCAHPELTRIR